MAFSGSFICQMKNVLKAVMYVDGFGIIALLNVVISSLVNRKPIFFGSIFEYRSTRDV